MSEPIERRIVDTIDLADDLRKQRGESPSPEEEAAHREKIEAQLRAAKKDVARDRASLALAAQMLRECGVAPQIGSNGEEDVLASAVHGCVALRDQCAGLLPRSEEELSEIRCAITAARKSGVGTAAQAWMDRVEKTFEKHLQSVPP